MPVIEYANSQKAHVFECAAKSCLCKNRTIRRSLDTGDAKSTGNLRRHVKVCWGEETVAAADNTWDVKTAREALANAKGVDGSITALFERVAKSKVTYCHDPVERHLLYGYDYDSKQ
jgi:hypothetical protein